LQIAAPPASRPDTDDAMPTPRTSSPLDLAASPAAAPATAPNATFSTNPFTASELAQLSSWGATGYLPPAFLIPIYKAAGRRYHVPWEILAAINSIETDYGRDLSVSSAGAIGWMQFMPSTWLQYKVSANENTDPNPYNPSDAIFSAAHYLAANGAAHNLRQAIFAYNHAQWYVEEVLWRAQLISDHPDMARDKHNGYSVPLAARYMRQLGRTDDGVDIETAPDGAAVYSITPGIVTAVASDPAGFGPNYPVIMSTAGPLAGHYIYYGHVAASLVHTGQQVLAGQPIAVIGHTGDAAPLGHGHIEIGFSDSAGDPLDHHGPSAWTTAGDAMRRLLVGLSAALGIKNS
jgi:murein DD-endopeptidase MepM/ murein hydrolase activator NlpD